MNIGTQIIDKYSALNQRERWMVFFAGLALVYALLNTLLLAPALKKQQGIQIDIAQTQTQLTALQQQIAAFEQSPVQDVDADNKHKIAVLTQAINTQKSQLTSLQSTLISPERMPELLKGLMRNHAKIQLLSMKTIAPVSFINNAQRQDASAMQAHESATEQPTIYKHGLELTLLGNYMDLLHCAEALQGFSQQLLWEKAVLKTKEYPQSELTVTLYTLSLDKTWLSI